MKGMKAFFFLITMSATSLLLMSSFWSKKETPTTSIQIVPIAQSPEPETVNLKIMLPEDGTQISTNDPVYLQMRLRGFVLAVDSLNSRKNELINSKEGQSIKIVIDNDFAMNYIGPSMNPFREQGDYYQELYRLKLGKMKNGVHIIRAFPCRSYGESLKGENTFDAVYFSVGVDSKETPNVLHMPFLTYNEPNCDIQYTVGKPILVDFYISNCELSADGYKVELKVDGKTEEYFTAWQPYLIYGLSKGSHTIELILLDKHKRKVPGPFNQVGRKISVH